MDAAPAIVTSCLRLRRSPGSVRRSAAPASQYLFPGCPKGKLRRFPGQRPRAQVATMCGTLLKKGSGSANPPHPTPQVQNVVGQKLKARTH